jgi:ribosomal protein S6
MPLYELLCLARPLLPRNELQRMIQKVGGMVYEKGGVVTNVVSYGKQPLAYKIKGVQGKFDEVRSQCCAGCIRPCCVSTAACISFQYLQ